MPRRWDGNVVDVGECGKFVDQSIAGKERSLPENRQVGPRAAPHYKLPVLIRVAASLSADRKVELCASLPGRLAQMTTAAGPCLFCGQDAPIERVDSGSSDR